MPLASAKKLNVTVPEPTATPVSVPPSVPTAAVAAKGGPAKKAAAAPAVAPTAAVSAVAQTKAVDTKKAGGAGAAAGGKAAAAVAVNDTAKLDEVKDELSNGETLLAGLLEKVGTLSASVKSIQTALKQLSKEFDKQKKIIDKVQKKKEKAKKSPSGFAKPCKISDELCDFIGIAKGTEQSRTDITRFINAYVKQHNLNNPENRREFFPDKKLRSILKVNDGDKVTYFVLQRLIAHHFPPSMSKLAAAKAS